MIKGAANYSSNPTAVPAPSPQSSVSYNQYIKQNFAQGIIPEIISRDLGLIDPKSSTGIEFNNKLKAIYDAIIPDEYKQIIGPNIKFIISTDTTANAFALRMEDPPTIILNAGLFTEEIPINSGFKKLLKNSIHTEEQKAIFEGRSSFKLVENINELALIIGHEVWHLVEQKKAGIDRLVFKSEESASDIKSFEFVHACGLSVEEASVLSLKLTQIGIGGDFTHLSDSHLGSLNRDTLARTAVALYSDAQPTLYTDEIDTSSKAIQKCLLSNLEVTEKLAVISSNPEINKKTKLQLRRTLLDNKLFDEIKETVIEKASYSYWTDVENNPEKLADRILDEVKYHATYIKRGKQKLSGYCLEETIKAVDYLSQILPEKKFNNFISEFTKNIYNFHPTIVAKLFSALESSSKIHPSDFLKEVRTYSEARSDFIDKVKNAEQFSLTDIKKSARKLAREHDKLIAIFGKDDPGKFALFKFDIVTCNPRLPVPWEKIYGNFSDPDLAKAAFSVGLIYDHVISSEIFGSSTNPSIYYQDHIKDIVIGCGLSHVNYELQEVFLKKADEQGKRSYRMNSFEVTRDVNFEDQRVDLLADHCSKNAIVLAQKLVKEICESAAKKEDINPSSVQLLKECVVISNTPIPGKKLLSLGQHLIFLTVNSDVLFSLGRGMGRENSHMGSTESSANVVAYRIGSSNRLTREKEGNINLHKFSDSYLNSFIQATRDTQLKDNACKDLELLLCSPEYSEIRLLLTSCSKDNYITFFDLPVIKILDQLPDNFSKEKKKEIVIDIYSEYCRTFNLHPDDQEQLAILLKEVGIIKKTNLSLSETVKRISKKDSSLIEKMYHTFKIHDELIKNTDFTIEQLVASYNAINNIKRKFETQNEILFIISSRITDLINKEDSDVESKVGAFIILKKTDKLTPKEEKKQFNSICKKLPLVNAQSRLNAAVLLSLNYDLVVKKDFDKLVKIITDAASEIYSDYDSSKANEVQELIKKILEIRLKNNSLKILDSVATAVKLKHSECEYIRSSIDDAHTKMRHSVNDKGVIFEIIKSAIKADESHDTTVAVLEFLLDNNPDIEVFIKKILKVGPQIEEPKALKRSFKTINEMRQGINLENLDNKSGTATNYFQLIFRVPFDKLERQEQIHRLQIVQQLNDFHNMFVSSPVIYQSVFLRELIITEMETDTRYKKIMNFALMRLFPSKNEESHVMKKFIESYADNMHPSQKSIFACILLNSTRNIDSEGSHSADFLLDVLSTDALKIKAGQKAAVTNGIPRNFREVLIKLTENADKPYYWEFDRWINEIKSESTAVGSVIQGNSVNPADCGTLESILGSASISVVGSLRNEENSTGYVISVIRPETSPRTKRESKVLRKVVEDIRTNHPELEPQANIFEKLVITSDRRLEQELSTKEAKRLFGVAGEMYNTIEITHNKKIFTCKVPKVVASGSVISKKWQEFHYILMEQLPGKSITNLINSGEISKDAVKEYCQVVCAIEFFNIARGRFCSDRTNGNILIDPNSTQIGQIDFLGMLDHQWDKTEYGDVLNLLNHITQQKNSENENNLSSILVKMAEGRTDASQSGLIQEIEKSLLSINVFAQELTPKELMSAALSGIIAAPGGPLKEYIKDNYEQFEKLIFDLTGQKLPPRIFVENFLFGETVPSVAMINQFTGLGLLQFSIK